MEYKTRGLRPMDYDMIMAVFSHYIENTMAAYMENVPSVDFLLEGVLEGGFRVLEVDGVVAGFGKIKKYHPSSVFSRTALVGYFIHPEYTGKGLGKILLEDLEKHAKAHGISKLLAHVSSENKPSRQFHKKNGFEECGHFPNIGTKFNNRFGLYWYIKDLEID